MLSGFTGSLVSEYFAETLLGEMFGAELGVETRRRAQSELVRWARTAGRRLGPVTSACGVHDLAGAPLSRILGFDPPVVVAGGDGRFVSCRLDGSAVALALVSAPWSESLDAAWRAASPHVVREGAAWCLATNGRLLRLLDVRRAVARSFVEFELEAAAADGALFSVMWGLCRAESFGASPLVERASAASARHTVGVCRSLRAGVLDAIGQLLASLPVPAGGSTPGDSALDALHGQALTLVYRILFLLFAESRGLVPLWHPIYRDNYSIEALRDLAERPGRPRGLWEALQAISRLAHAGCRAGTLRVTPFNGRLFAPAVTPLGESGRVDDDAARRVLLALSTAPARGGGAPVRISYRDLGVEQLGAVYESVLDYRPRVARRARETPPARGRIGRSAGPSDRPVIELAPGSGARKATGTFYTPRAITTYLVRRVLAPLVDGASPDEVLGLRVVDPAMGSGAFLVAACRFLADAYEAAVTNAGGCHPSDISDADRRGFRRLVAQRCLYGVDRNPIAVQLARLSLWLCTLAPERPLTFLDHRLLTGDSLIGASLDDVCRRPPGTNRGTRGGREQAALPLFDAEEVGPALRGVLRDRLQVATLADESLDVVREKERLLAGINSPSSPVSAWKAVADLWCGFAFREDLGPAGDRMFAALADSIRTGRSSLPPKVAARWLEEARAIAVAHRFLHWPLEFPEVFHSADGGAIEGAGFDAVVANPPWDMIRDDGNGGSASTRTRDETAGIRTFVRSSGIYRAQGEGHQNLYQLFVERAFQLVRPGGRVGLVVPWGLAADQGCAPLRRLLFDRTRVDAWIGFENTSAIFPIHRSVRFLVTTATAGGRTESLPCRLGLRDPDELDASSASPGAPGRFRDAVAFPRRLLERLSPGDLAVPDARTEADVALLEKIAATFPPLGSEDGWGAEFGRELNATDDRRHFVGRSDGVPVLEGKHVEPFRVRIPADVRRIPSEVARDLLGPNRAWNDLRLGYRDVASATNRLTLIAAVVPAGCVTVHTVFCLKTRLHRRDQDFLCGVLNSFVANYLVRLRVTTHVTTRILSRLPVPRPPAGDALFELVADLAARLRKSPVPERDEAYPELQAAVARLYCLTSAEFRHVLATFPLVEDATKEASGRKQEAGSTK